MNPEFEKQSNELMLSALRRKRSRKRMTLMASSAVVLLVCLQMISVFAPDSESPALPGFAQLEAGHEAAKAYIEIQTASGHYSLPQPLSMDFAIINTKAGSNYSLMDQEALIAALPEDLAIRIEADGSATLLFTP